MQPFAGAGGGGSGGGGSGGGQLSTLQSISPRGSAITRQAQSVVTQAQVDERGIKSPKYLIKTLSFSPKIYRQIY